MKALTTPNLPLNTVVNLLETNQGSVQANVLDVAQGNADVGAVEAWYVNDGSATPVGWGAGVDAPGYGRSALKPFASSEYLCETLCPGGLEYIPQANTTDIIFAPGAYGAINLWGRFPSDTPQFGAVVRIYGLVTSSAPIVLSAVVPTVTKVTRGQLTTVGAQNFLPNKRLRVTSGAASNAMSYLMGQNASPKNYFCKSWYNFDTDSMSGPAPGDSVVMDTLTVSFSRVNITFEGPGYLTVSDAGIHGPLNAQSSSTGGTVSFVGCEHFGDDGGGSSADYYATFSVFASCNFKGGDCQFSQGFPTFYGSIVQQFASVSAYTAATMLVRRGSAVNGGRMYANKPSGCLTFIEDTEFANGAGVPALQASQGATLLFPTGNVWGLSGNYATGISLSSLSMAECGSIAQLAIPATVELSMTGHNLAYTDVPRSYDRAGCVFAIDPDPAALPTTT